MLVLASALLLMTADPPVLRGKMDVEGTVATPAPAVHRALASRTARADKGSKAARAAKAAKAAKAARAAKAATPRTKPVPVKATAARQPTRPLILATDLPKYVPPAEAQSAAVEPPAPRVQPNLAPALASPTPTSAQIKGLDKDLQAAMNGPQGPPPSAREDSSDIPPGAPDDDYGLVAWCQGALTGHMSLYTLVKPQMDEMERSGADKAREDKDNARIDEEQQQAGREYLALYAHARPVADAHSGGSQRPRGDQARADGEHIWSAARLADPSTRMWSWIMWELPARCETAARRLERNEGVMGEVIRGHHPDARPDARPN